VFGGPSCLHLQDEVELEAARTSEMVSYHITAHCHNLEDHSMNLHCCENLMSLISYQNDEWVSYSICILQAMVHNKHRSTVTVPKVEEFLKPELIAERERECVCAHMCACACTCVIMCHPATLS